MENQFDSLAPEGDIVEFDFPMGLTPLIGAMCEALAIPEMINRLLPRDSSARVDHGLVVKAFIIDMLTNRSPLLHFASNMAKLDCAVLFGYGVTADVFTQARLGDTLDAVSTLNDRAFTSAVSVRALHLHGESNDVTHIDSTNFSLHGSYSRNDSAGDFEVTPGHPKDGRRAAKLVTLGGALQQSGLPIFGEGLSGNTSDAVWFREAMNEMAQLYSGTLETNPILIYDAAASNKETFDLSLAKNMPCIIRLSETFSATAQCTEQAWKDDKWQDVGTIAAENKKDAASYRLRSFQVRLGTKDWRVLVVHSSGLEKQKTARLSRSLPKLKTKLTKTAAMMAKKAHATEELARDAASAFVKKLSGLEKLLSYRIQIQPQTVEKYATLGRPRPDSKKTQVTSYHTLISIGNYDPEQRRAWVQQESCFCLADSVPPTRRTDIEILREYKKQWKIEGQFEFTKVPLVLEPVWLHRPNRIKALLLILWLAVLVAAYLRHRMHQSRRLISETHEKNRKTPALDSSTNTVGGTRSQTEPTPSLPNEAQEQKPLLHRHAGPPTGGLMDEVLDNTVSGRILLPGGRLVENPTFGVIRGLLQDAKTRGIFEDDQYKRTFHPTTRRALLGYVVCMGFHPSIYLESFKPSFDLWRYAPLNPVLRE